MKKPSRTAIRGRKVAIYVFAIVLAIWVLFPIFWTALTSLQTLGEARRIPPSLIPTTLRNYFLLVNYPNGANSSITSGEISVPTRAGEMLYALRNSSIVGLAVVATNLTAGTLAAYTFSRFRFRGSWVLFIYTIASRFIPAVAVFIPFYLIVRELNLLDTTFAVFVIHAAYTLPFSIWVLHNYLATVPTDIEESALVDGYSRFETIRKVVFPVIWPGLVAIAIFSFMFSYNEFFFAQILTYSEASHTVPVIVVSIGGALATPTPLAAAAGIIAMIPPVMIFMIFRRRIIGGLATGGVK